MDRIKKSIEEISLPKNLHKVARESLNKSTKEKGKRWVLPTVAILFLTLCTSTLVFSNYISIPDFFESKE